MGRHALFGAAIAVGAAALTSPVFAQERTTNECVNKQNDFTPEQQISGCTSAIESGKWSGSGLSWAYGNRCIGYKDKGEYDRAIEDCDRALELDPRNPFAYNSRGAAYYFKQDYDQSIADYAQAIRINPRFIDPIHNTGISYAAKGDYDTAIAMYNKALQIDGKDATALYNRGVAKQHLGDQDGGDADIAAAREIDPKIGR
jgi:tetratricopeptide (TPR) repeat protein